MEKATDTTGFQQRCKTILGNQYSKFQEAQSSPLPKIIRVNTLRNSVEQFLKWSAKNHPDWELTPHIFGKGIFAINRESHTIPLGKTLGHLQGRFYIQEASSCLPPLALNIKPGQKVLDIASAPGSKTTQIAALMKGEGLLVANEFSASRAKILAYNLQKCGVSNVALTHFSGEKFGRSTPKFFERILVDAPCTGEGTARKDSDALTNWSEKRICTAAKLQKSLILSAFESLVPGGALTYSTCTLGPEENEEVVEFLVESFPQEAEVIDLSTLFPGAEKAKGLSSFEKKNFPNGKKMLRIWPHLFNSEGFFVASLRKRSASLDKIEHQIKRGKYKNNLPHRKPAKKRFVLHGKERPLNPGTFLRQKDSTTEFVRSVFADEYGFLLPTPSNFFRKNADIWLLPNGSEEILPAIRFDRVGIRLGKIVPCSKKSMRNTFRLSHECVLALGKFFSGSRVQNISFPQAQKFLQGVNIDPVIPDAPKGDLVLLYEGLPLGLVKNLGNIWKNNLPRNFVIPEVY